MKVTGITWNPINEQIRSDLGRWYGQHREVLSFRGHSVVDRALATGTLAGDKGVRLLLDPAVLVGLRVDAEQAYALATICNSVPFTGNYNLWDPVRAIYALTYRTLVTAADPRSEQVALHLSWAENGELLAPPLLDAAMTNRVNGHLLEQSLQHELFAPLTLPWTAFAVSMLRELVIMWAYGGSQRWPRTRIDDEIARINALLSNYYAAPRT